MSINLFNKNYLQIEKELNDKILNINGIEKIDNFGIIQSEKNKELFFKKYIQITNNNENEEEKEKFAIIQKDLLIKPNINQVINSDTSLGLKKSYYDSQYGYYNNIDFLKNLITNNKKYFYFYFYNKNNNILKKIILPNNIDFSKWFLNIAYIESKNETRFNSMISTGTSSAAKHGYWIFFNNKLNSAFLSISLAIKDTKYKESFPDGVFDRAFTIPSEGDGSYRTSDTYPWAVFRTPLMFKIWSNEDNPIHICQKIDNTITDYSTEKKFYLNKNRNALFINNNSFVDENNDWNLNTNGYFQAYIVQ